MSISRFRASPANSFVRCLYKAIISSLNRQEALGEHFCMTRELFYRKFLQDVLTLLTLLMTILWFTGLYLDG